jgi:hypothetical protein
MADTPQSEISGQVMFYKQPEPLSIETHRMLGVKRVDKPFRFLVGSNLVPITVNEFGVAASSYPLIFVGPEKTPVAVMGARAGENVFVSPDGDVDPEAYLPAFVRRYPFAFAADPSGERLVVCIDRAASMLGEAPDIPFFNGDKPSQFTEDAIEFCKEFEQFRASTQLFLNRMTEYNLWETKSVSLTPPPEQGGTDEPIKIAEYFAISEPALQNIEPAKLVTLRDEGWLGMMYAHMISLLLWPKILNRAINIAAAEAAAAGQAPLAR